jgi:hypothetical protein
MIVCVLSVYQYIKTQTRRKYLLSGNASIIGDIPEGATNRIDAHYDNYYGFQLSNENISLWGPEIRGSFICGSDGQ